MSAGLAIGLVIAAGAWRDAARAGDLRITGLDRNAVLTWTNGLTPGVVMVDQSPDTLGNWQPGPSAYSVTGAGQVPLEAVSAPEFFRLQSASVPPTAVGFTNLIEAYGELETLAGTGAGRTDGVSYWQSAFEGGPGTAAALSRPHYAMADAAGDIFIADKNSHSVLRLGLDGTIHTYAGTHTAGFNGDGPAAATTLQLNAPNALWVHADGTLHILDTDNGLVRRVTTNGVLTTLFAATGGSALNGGRTLWVKDDESLAYFGNETRVRRWTPTNGVQTLASGFVELGDFYVESGGDLIVADRGGNLVYRVHPDGSKSVIAGNGSATGGGDGAPALLTGLFGPRGVWPVPTGGYLLLLHDGCQLWYLDTGGVVRLLLNGAGGNTHSGDGAYFYNPSLLKISEGRSVSMDSLGNIVICDSDYGFIRRIRFRRLPH